MNNDNQEIILDIAYTNIYKNSFERMLFSTLLSLSKELDNEPDEHMSLDDEINKYTNIMTKKLKLSPDQQISLRETVVEGLERYKELQQLKIEKASKGIGQVQSKIDALKKADEQLVEQKSNIVNQLFENCIKDATEDHKTEYRRIFQYMSTIKMMSIYDLYQECARLNITIEKLDADE